ncbi:MAG TPA: hypothetical protein VNA88_15410 [Candidatus Kapabacteria bacterium]|jgi:hypothetical protein|nr:hypothetical protein [Candidatus Kapabacteria bacterium]
MSVSRLVGMVSLFLLIALPALAQSTGANVMSDLGDNLRRELTGYTIQSSNDRIQVLDKESGAEVLSIREQGPQNVAITANIGSVSEMSSESLAIVEDRIALFNFSSDVGTLTYDDQSGTVAMSHNLNPRAVPVAQMVRVTSLCGDVAREQARTLSAQ